MAESLLSQCWNEAVTRMLGRISVRCGLISQGSWPGTERLLCRCDTAAAGWLLQSTKANKLSWRISRKQHVAGGWIWESAYMCVCMHMCMYTCMYTHTTYIYCPCLQWPGHMSCCMVITRDILPWSPSIYLVDWHTLPWNQMPEAGLHVCSKSNPSSRKCLQADLAQATEEEEEV